MKKSKYVHDGEHPQCNANAQKAKAWVSKSQNNNNDSNVHEKLPAGVPERKDAASYLFKSCAIDLYTHKFKVFV